ncbi:MAG TPA: M13 family metallopeptidase [Holophagaceae bacterium]|nr:M13 family metallopeptidase [Holophagaceae bacterium]
MRPNLTPLLLALAAATAPAQAPHKAAPLAAAAPAVHGLDLAGMDRTVKPGDDFYAFANGAWMKQTEIPADQGSQGIWSVLVNLTSKQTAAIIQEAAAAKAPEGTDRRKIGDYYTTFMDEGAIEAAGLKPLQPGFTAIQAIADRTALSRALGETLRPDVDVLNSTNFTTSNLFGLWVAQDLNDPNRYVPFLLQGGLSLPERSFYLDSSEAMVKLRAGYQTHLATLLRLAGLAGADAEARAAAVVALETRMAQAHLTREESGDVKKGNNPWRRSEFAAKAPGLDWEAYFAAAGLDKAQDFVVWQPAAFTGLSALVGEVSLDTWKDYLRLHLIQDHASVLPKAIAEQSFAFFGREVNGVPKQRDRWKRAVSATNGALGEIVGKTYVARHFPASSKRDAQRMVADIIAAFDRRIDQLAWMSPETKVKAKAKLAVLKVSIGYPDRWQDYAGLKVVAGDAYGNLDRAGRFALAMSLRKLGRKVDRSEWVMFPQTINAVNLPALNAMNFPAAILQPPFFDPKRPAAMNYGAIGTVIGHEISHSFDDTGALFDATGKLQNWWTPADFSHFQAAADQLAAQFSAYKPFPDLAVNGKQTLGENIADVAGLAAAYDAYRLSLKGKPAPKVQGLTGDQQFFLAFAQVWREKTREALERQQVLMDGHAPGRFRTFTARNNDAWYEAFGVKTGDALYLAPDRRIRIW